MCSHKTLNFPEPSEPHLLNKDNNSADPTKIKLFNTHEELTTILNHSKDFIEGKIFVNRKNIEYLLKEKF